MQNDLTKLGKTITVICKVVFIFSFFSKNELIVFSTNSNFPYLGTNVVNH